ncbi:hypothetical protein ACFFU1_11590 [Algibacter miyuki]|uniref:Uncharacterized protein n=1 Tax=Algibacter miyuki TaxID=1306933 RepID=A0ABV5H0Y0_9FLAO|nr:hypothetical protein [Algibacter miyuki]MDN3664389.1 hypothetical protein [Algibacter miyuki]
MNKETIQLYLNNFRRFISPYLRKDINFKSIIYPANDGAIVELKFQKTSPIKDEFRKKENSVTDSLKRINQHAFGGNLAGFKFSGTNLIMEEGRIIIIKDDNKTEWSIEQVKKDVEKLIHPQKKNL